jgi:hypothetical protein
MILLSAHKDTVRNNFKLCYQGGKYVGLLDNFIGVMIVNSLLIEDPNIVRLEKQGKIGVFFGDSEEWGTITDMPKLRKEDIALVVDVAIGDQYKGLDISLENISGFTKEEITDLRESLIWEGFKVKTKLYDGNKDDEDEAWYWKKKGNKAISFIIPVQAGSKETGWHVDDCFIYVENVVIAQQILKRTINYLL